MSVDSYWIYILYCENHNYYTGYTTDIKRRYREHVKGTLKCKYTRSFKPVKIAQSWQVLDTKNMAMKIERYIKKLNKNEKLKLINSPDLLEDIFPCKTITALDLQNAQAC